MKNRFSFLTFVMAGFLTLFVAAVDAHAQSASSFSGIVVDEENHAIDGISVVVKAGSMDYGVVTDTVGNFRVDFPKCRSIVVAFSGVGYKALTDTIMSEQYAERYVAVMHRSGVALDEVTVESERAMVSNGGFLFLPSVEQKKSAGDAVSLLRNMMIPNLVIDPDGSIGTHSKQPVSIFIDGKEADQNDLAVFRPEDVLKVEYYERPMDRFLGKSNVVNFIMKKYKYGGYVSVTGSQAFILNTGGYGTAAKINSDKLTYQIVGSAGYMNNEISTKNTEETFRFGNQNGAFPEELNRTTTSNGSNGKSRNYGGAFSVDYSDKKFRITNAVGLYFRHQPERWDESTVTYSPAVIKDATSRNDVNSRSLLPYWNGYFYAELPSNQMLTGNASFQYSRVHNNQSYKLMADGFDSFTENNLEADNYSASALVYYQKSFKHNNSISVSPQFDLSVYDNHYFGSTESLQKLITTRSAITVGYRQAFGQKLNLDLKMQGVLDTYGVSGEDKVVKFLPSPNLNFNYSINNKNSLNLWMGFFQYAPSASDLNDVDVQENEIIWLRGNPKLKSFNNLQGSLSYTWLPSRIFNLSAAAYISTSFDNEIYRFTPEQGRMIRESDNSGNCTYANFALSPSLYLLNGSLQIQPRVCLVPQFQTGYYDRSYCHLDYSMSVAYFKNNFSINAYYMSDQININVSGYKYEIEPMYGISARYNIKNWLIAVGASNVIKHHFADRKLYTQHYDAVSRLYEPSNTQISIAVRYTFDFGRKVNRGEDDLKLNTNVKSGALTVDN